MACVSLDVASNFHNDQPMDLRINIQNEESTTSSNHGEATEGSKATRIAVGKQKRRSVNVFKKHKLKYRYLQKKHKHGSDSGNFGSSSSSSMMGSSGTTKSIEKKSMDESTSSPCCSSSPSSGNSASPQNFAHLDIQSDQQMCMMLGHAVPLVVMLQGQLQSTNNCSNDFSYPDTMLYKCNMCNMFSNNLADVLNHVSSNHPNIHHCFVCNQFHGSKNEYERHKDVCATARQALQQINDGRYQGNRRPYSRPITQDKALNLTVVGDSAKRAAQIVHNKKGKDQQKKIKKLQKCMYCKKVFFGRFYLQRHLRSHTGEKLCHCHICGKGFAECRNLRNHMSRFHTSSESISGGSRPKSVSTNNTSDSDHQTEKTMTAQHGNGESHIFSSQLSTECGHISASTSLLDSTMSKQIGAIQSCQAWTAESNVYNRNHLNSDMYNPISSSSGAAYPTTSLSSSAGDRSWSVQSSVHRASSNTEQYNYRPTTYSASVSIDQTQNCHSQSSNDKSSTKNVNGSKDQRASEDVKVTPTYLGSTSSRLELNNGQQGHEQSLHPICDGHGGKLFRCQVCDKIFRTKFAMQRHLDFHADKRPFQCNQCAYKAKTRPQLKVHVMRHSGQKGFNCTTCNYSCVTHSDLNRHCKSRSHLFRASLLEQKNTDSQATTNTTNSVCEKENIDISLKHGSSIENFDKQ